MSDTVIDGSPEWPFAKVPFTVDELSFPSGFPQRANIDNAVAAWNAVAADVQIVPRQNEPDFVHFVPDKARTASQVGRRGSRQVIQAAYYPAIGAGGAVAAIDQREDQVDSF